MQKLLSKQTRALLRLRAYLAMQVSVVHAIALLNAHQSDLARAKKMEHLKLVCTSAIQASAPHRHGAAPERLHARHCAYWPITI